MSLAPWKTWGYISEERSALYYGCSNPRAIIFPSQVPWSWIHLGDRGPESEACETKPNKIMYVAFPFAGFTFVCKPMMFGVDTTPIHITQPGNQLRPAHQHR